MTLDFTHLSPVCIDTSPSPCARKCTLLLEDSELQSASFDQLERFWRVWYTDRRASAPHLQEVTIVLQASFHSHSHTVNLSGINKFLRYFHDFVEDSANPKHLDVYLDTWSQVEHGNIRHELFERHERLLTIEAGATATSAAVTAVKHHGGATVPVVA